MGCYYVIGLRVDHRRANAAGLQETLTRYGCNIRLRVGRTRPARAAAPTTA